MRPKNNCVRLKVEFEESTRIIRERGWPVHAWNSTKNWDSRWLESVMVDGDLLDIGCVTSAPLEIATALGLRGQKVGIDQCTEYNNWKIPDGCELIQGVAEALPFDGESFDFVTCLSVIEHDVDIPKFCSEASRVLRKNGILVVTFDYWPSPKDPGALDLIDFFLLTKEMRDAGFEIDPFHMETFDRVIDGRYTFGALTATKR